MKNQNIFTSKIAKLAVSCLTLVLTLSANSSGCFVVYQPKTPEKLNSFKRIK